MTLQPAPTAMALRGLCGGAVHLPGDPGYDLARTAWNVQVDERPAAVTYPAFPDEVADVLRAAAAAGLRVAPQGTGHGAAPLEGRLGDAVLLRTSAMTELAVDAERRSVRVGAGVLWGDLVDVLARHDLAALHPSSPDVGVVGYSLGGGISWYGRQFGLQSSAVTAVDVVLADGSALRATADAHAELFWAIRGGGAPLGVVTALEFDILPIRSVVGGLLAWDWTAIERVMPAWVAWCRDAPESVTTALRLLQVPDSPGLPDLFRGRRLVVVDGVVLGQDVHAQEVLAPLRALCPEMDTFARVPAPDVVRMHMEPEGPTPGYASSTLVAGLTGEAVAAVLEAAGPESGSRLSVVELRQLGGALGRPAATAGALSHLDGDFLALGIGVQPDPAAWPQQRVDADRLMAALQPWATGRQYLTMVDARTDSRKAFPPGVHERLSRIRADADPGGLFVAQHGVPEQR